MNEPSSSLLIIKNTDFSTTSSSLLFSTPTSSASQLNSAFNPKSRVSSAETFKTTAHNDENLVRQQPNENYFTRLKVNQNENSLKERKNVSFPVDQQQIDLDKPDLRPPPNQQPPQYNSQYIQVINY